MSFEGKLSTYQCCHFNTLSHIGTLNLYRREEYGIQKSRMEMFNEDCSTAKCSTIV